MTSHILKKSGAYLPHWRKQNGIYAVQFRLADSLPSEKRKDLEWEKKDIHETASQLNRSLTGLERLRVLELEKESIQKFLQNGYGACYLAQDSIAKIVADALKFFDNKRYKLFAWCIMPNHVHVVVQPFQEEDLSKILHSWKTFTAREANKALSRAGSFWCRESYDHLTRSKDDLLHSIEYTWSNSGTENWKWRWKASVEDIKKACDELEAHMTAPETDA